MDFLKEWTENFPDRLEWNISRGFKLACDGAGGGTFFVYWESEHWWHSKFFGAEGRSFPSV